MFRFDKGSPRLIPASKASFTSVPMAEDRPPKPMRLWAAEAVNQTSMPDHYAAKLCALRESTYASFITAEVYNRLREDVKFGGEPKRSMWEEYRWDERALDIYRSRWHWAP